MRLCGWVGQVWTVLEGEHNARQCHVRLDAIVVAAVDQGKHSPRVHSGRCHGWCHDQRPWRVVHHREHAIERTSRPVVGHGRKFKRCGPGRPSPGEGCGVGCSEWRTARRTEKLRLDCWDELLERQGQDAVCRTGAVEPVECGHRQSQLGHQCRVRRRARSQPCLGHHPSALHVRPLPGPCTKPGEAVGKFKARTEPRQHGRRRNPRAAIRVVRGAG
mmetsp:Transcript_12732/g.32604  ORF Transcript_12732/g.32604 Transcript_12732/m.32604 type:complete len:217 (-) Transcript_12732:1099-1749(-)